MANLKDKIEYEKSKYAYDYAVVRMYIYNEFLGSIKFFVDEDIMLARSIMIDEFDKAPYFNLTVYDLLKLAEEYMRSLGYKVINN